MAFSKETVRFLAGLRRNNKKEWFEAHRDDYDHHFIEPAKAFVAALAPRLARIDPAIHAEPRVNGSILRINRDVRFSKDKSLTRTTSISGSGAARTRAGTAPASSSA